MQSYSLKENSCRNFAPNIFNKNKCQNCFKPRETHLLSDKDLSKAKPIYYGWLLLAPIGTDFDNPVHKSRKWQRRWFVLFEHGALRYALDDNANTLPQGTINMNICSDVVHAETMTGQKHSLCICLPEMKYFIRGENREDSLGWYDQLIVYPETAKEDARIKKKLMKKRKSVEPSHVRAKAKPPSNLPELHRSRPSSTSSLGTRSPTSPMINRGWGSTRESPINQRHKSASGTTVRPSDLVRVTRPTSYVDLSSPVKESSNTTNLALEDGKMETNDSSNSAKMDPTYFSMDRRQPNSDRKSSDNQRIHTSDSTSSVDSNGSNGDEDSSKKLLKEQQRDASRHKRLSERQHVRKEDQSNKENNDPGLSDGPGSPRGSVGSGDATSPSPDSTVAAAVTSRDDDKRGRSISRRSTKLKQGTQTPEASSASTRFLRRAKSLDRKAYESITISPDLLNFKKGWLTKLEDGEKETGSKHWFVLADQMLKYYKDSVAEDYAEADGEIKLKNCEKVNEIDVSRNYGFQIHTTDGNIVTLTAMTSGIRRNWIDAILKSAKPPAHSQPDLTHSTDKTSQQKEDLDGPKKEPDMPASAAEELTVTERPLRRRARIRDRRKQGRSRTYDFAEFRPLAAKAREENNEIASKDPGVRSPDSDLFRSRNRSGGSTRASRSKDMEASDLVTSHKPTSHPDAPSTTDRKSPEFQLSPQELQKSLDTQWQKVERLHLPLNHVKPNRQPSSSSPEPSSAIKTLQEEVDSLKQQMEKNQLERVQMLDEISMDIIDGAPNDFQESEDPVGLRRRFEQQRIQIDNLKEELNASAEKGREKEKELRECSMQLDISCSEFQRAESQLSKVQNELTMERKRREEAEKDHERRTQTQLRQVEEGESRLKKSESQLLEAQRKIRELERQANLQKDHKKEVENLHEQIKMLQRQTEEQQEEMTQLHEDFEGKCQNQKQLEDSLSNARDMIESYEEQIHKLHGKAQTSEKDELTKAQLKRDVEALTRELDVYKTACENLKIHCQKLEAQIQINNDRNKALQEDLEKEKKESSTLKISLKARDEEAKSGRHEIKKLQKALEKTDVILKSQSETGQKAQEDLKSLLEENKKLKEEIQQEHAHRQMEAQKLNAKIQDLTVKLGVTEKRISEVDNVRAKSKSKPNGSSFKAKVTELEAEMEDTGQMLVARLTALETPRRRETDDSDEVGSNSSTSSLNELRRQSRKDDEKVKMLTTQLHKTENELETAHAKLEEVMKALQVARSATPENSAKSESEKLLQESKKSVEDLQRVVSEQNKKCASVRSCIQELHNKVVEVQKEEETEKARHMLPFLESVLVDTLQLLGGSPLPTVRPKNIEVTKSEDDKEAEKTTSAKLRMLTERLKTTGGRLSPLSSPVLSRSQSPLATPHTPPKDRSPVSNRVTSPTTFTPIKKPTDLQTHPGSSERRLSKEERERLFAEQLSLQAMVITEMAASLERYQAEKTFDPSSPLYAKISEGLQELSSHDLKSDSNSNLLRLSDTLSEKLLLESHFIHELAKLRDSHLSGMKSSTSRTRSKSEASSNKSSAPKFMATGGKSSKLPSDIEQLAAMSVTHTHMNYILQVYNDRICRLARTAKEAQHSADSFQRKLRELVHACKTQDVEQVSRLAVEVDTGVSPAQPVDELPSWKQQVDYGTLHGAQASLLHLDLSTEASFFRQLAKDVASMSTNVHSLVDTGAKIIALNGTLSKFLKPSELGQHATTIAHEAISQAELVFLSQKIRKDYELELQKMKASVKQQTAHCEVLQSKLKEMEEGDAVRMQELKMEHKKKVERLMQQLALVEKARVEMSSDMDANLTRFAQKQQKEMDTCAAKHKEETETLQRDLNTAKVQLQQTAEDYVTEVEKLTGSLKEIKKEHERQTEESRKTYNRILSEAKADFEQGIDTAAKAGLEKEKRLKDEFKKELDERRKEHDEELYEHKKKRKQEMENLEKMHEKEMERLNAEKKAALNQAVKEWKEKLNSEKRRLEEKVEKERANKVKELKALQEKTVSITEMEEKVERTKQEYNIKMLKQESLHEEALKGEREALTKKIREQLEEEMKTMNSIPWADDEEPVKPADSISVASIASSIESESKDALRSRILALEAQIESMGQQSYQVQLDEIKTLCEKSFADIEETHVKQLDELSRQHHLEIERLQEEKAREMEEDVTATKMAIESMRKHHQEELERLKNQEPTVGRENSVQQEIKELKKQIEVLSEHYTKKCVELSKLESKLEEAEEKLHAVDMNNQLLQEHNNELAKKLESELDKLKTRSKQDPNSSGMTESAGDVYQLQVKLRVKKSEIALLKQESEALKQQLETAIQDKKYSQQKHKSLFEEMTAAKSREGKSQRDLQRLRDKISRLEKNGDNSDNGILDSPEQEPPKSAGYDFMKSKSHPDFPSLQDVSTKATSASVKRRSSDRSSRSKSLKESSSHRS